MVLPAWLLPAVAAFVGFGVGNTVLKYASQSETPAATVLAAIYPVALGLTAAWMAVGGHAVQTEPFAVGLAIGVAFFGGTWCLYRALDEGVAVRVFPIMRLNTLVTVGLAVVVLVETPSMVVVAGIGAAVAAVVLLSRPTDANPQISDRGPPPGLWFWLAVGALVAFGTANFAVEMGAETVGSRLSLLLGAYVTSPVLAVAYAARRRSPVTRRAVGLGSVVAAFYVLGGFGLMTGYAADTVSRVAPFMGLNILVPMGASVIFWEESVDLQIAAGTALALVAMVLLSVG